MVLRSCGLAAVGVALLSACGGSTSSPTEAAEGSGAQSTASLPVENLVPAELKGTWRLDSETYGGPVRLYLRESSYSVSAGVAHSGPVEVDGEVMTFASNCGGSSVEDLVGQYRWRLKRDTLHFTLVGKDKCGGRAELFDDATYHREG